MLKRSHALIGAAAGVTVAHVLHEPLVAGGIVGGLAGVISDGDHPQSFVGRMLPAWFHRLTPGHRGQSHSLAFVALVAGLCWWLGFPLLALLAGVGVTSHLLGDAATEAGIPWAWPISKRRMALPRLLAIKTGGAAEVVVVVGVLALTALYLTGGNIRP